MRRKKPTPPRRPFRASRGIDPASIRGGGAPGPPPRLEPPPGLSRPPNCPPPPTWEVTRPDSFECNLCHHRGDPATEPGWDMLYAPGATPGASEWLGACPGCTAEHPRRHGALYLAAWYSSIDHPRAVRVGGRGGPFAVRPADLDAWVALFAESHSVDPDVVRRRLDAKRADGSLILADDLDAVPGRDHAFLLDGLAEPDDDPDDDALDR